MLFSCQIFVKIIRCVVEWAGTLHNFMGNWLIVYSKAGIRMNDGWPVYVNYVYSIVDTIKTIFLTRVR